MLELRPDEIHLWLAFHRSDPHAALREEYGALLSAPEREREARFRFDEDRFRFRVTRAMARRVLAGYLDIDAADCQFENNAHGRPSLVNRLAGDSISFNISHTKDLVMLAVTRGRELGVDVERIEGRRRTVDLAKRFFADFESERVVNAPEQERDALFFEYWTLKESYIKARGLGLAIPLGKFGFHLKPAGPELWIHSDLADTADRWTFMQPSVSEAHRAAICVERAGLAPPRLSTRDFAEQMLATPRARA